MNKENLSELRVEKSSTPGEYFIYLTDKQKVFVVGGHDAKDEHAYRTRIRVMAPDEEGAKHQATLMLTSGEYFVTNDMLWAWR